MKYITIVLLLLASNALALDEIQKQIRETPEMSRSCISHIEYNKRKVIKYEGRIAAAIAIGREPPAITRLKLNYYKAELQNWIDYCKE